MLWARCCSLVAPNFSRALLMLCFRFRFCSPPTLSLTCQEISEVTVTFGGAPPAKWKIERSTVADPTPSQWTDYQYYTLNCVGDFETKPGNPQKPEDTASLEWEAACTTATITGEAATTVKFNTLAGRSALAPHTTRPAGWFGAVWRRAAGDAAVVAT
jgi:hypothetical protein